MSEFRKVHLPVNNEPNVAFDGKLLGEYSTQNANGTKERWTELRLWQTEAGTLIVESVGKSSGPREVDLRDVKIIQRVRGVADVLEQQDRAAVMDALGWAVVAKAFARTMGWDVVRRVA